MTPTRRSFFTTFCLLTLITGCKSQPPAPAQPARKVLEGISGPPPGKAHPLHKHIELAGLRLTEIKPGRLRFRCLVVNHSLADVGDLELQVALRTVVAKEGDGPLAEFKAKVQGLGPEEFREVTVELPTKLKAYEIPDWQFLRAQFEFLSPAP